MTYRSESANYHHGNNDNASSRYTHVNTENQTNFYDHNSTSYADRSLIISDRGFLPDLATQGALDAWAPRRTVQTNDYRDPDTFRNPYQELGQAEQLLHTRGFDAARPTYLRSIDEADGISLKNIKEDRHYDMQNLRNIDAREAHMQRAGAPFEQIQNLENQRHQILNNEKELNSLYYAPANTRISMGLACIKTGEPMEIMEGQRLIEEAKQKRPEIADDPRLQNLIDNAYQVGYRNHNSEVTPSVYHYGRTDYPLQSQTDAPSEQAPRGGDPIPRAKPWQPEYNPNPVTPQPHYEAPPVSTGTQYRPEPPVSTGTQYRPEPPVSTGTQYRPEPPVSTGTQYRPETQTQPAVEPPTRLHPEIPAPPGVPGDGSRPTRELVDNSQSRISDAEALNWLHGKYQHLTIEQKAQNDRDAQKAYDETSWSMNPMAPSWDSRALGNKQDKLVEFSKGFRTDLTNLFELSSQPHSSDSDFARQALITIIKNSAQNMSNEAGNREISEECCAQVKELCKAGANGRSEMVDAVRIGLTESSHLPGGAKNYLMDGLVFLAADKPPAITAETAGRIALMALKHEIDNTPRLGAPDRRGESRDEITQRQIRLIGILDKLGFKNSLADLQDIVKSNADDRIRQAAANAVGDLQRSR